MHAVIIEIWGVIANGEDATIVEDGVCQTGSASKNGFETQLQMEYRDFGEARQRALMEARPHAPIFSRGMVSAHAMQGLIRPPQVPQRQHAIESWHQLCKRERKSTSTHKDVRVIRRHSNGVDGSRVCVLGGEKDGGGEGQLPR